MVTIRWTEAAGWHDAQLVPYAPIPLDPATNVLHYGQAIFEGLKAYRQADGSIATFRPEANAAPLRSARAARLAMPELPEELFLGLDRGARRPGPGVRARTTRRSRSTCGRSCSRPRSASGVRPANEYLYVLIASPVGAYFPRGVKPVSVWLSTEYVRAAPGGTGEAKFAGNYAASLIAQAQAAEQGCDQVVWLDAHEHRWVEEMGGMNLFFVYGTGDDARIVTPELTGSLLAGVTRDSLLSVAKDLGYGAEEGRINIDDWREGNALGRDHRGLRLRHRRGHHPGRRGEERRALVDRRRRRPRRGDHAAARRRCSTSRPADAEDAHGWMHTLVPRRLTATSTARHLRRRAVGASGRRRCARLAGRRRRRRRRRGLGGEDVVARRRAARRRGARGGGRRARRRRRSVGAGRRRRRRADSTASSCRRAGGCRSPSCRRTTGPKNALSGRYWRFARGAAGRAREQARTRVGERLGAALRALLVGVDAVAAPSSRGARRPARSTAARGRCCVPPRRGRSRR